MITIKALPPSRRPSLLPRASSQGFAQSIMQKYRHEEGRDPGYLALIHRDFSPSIGGQENHFHQTSIHVHMQVQVDSYLGLNREMLPNGQAGFPWPKERAVITQASGSGRKVQPATLIHELFRKWESSKLIEKVYLPRITAVSNGRDRYRWSSYVQSLALEKSLPQGRFIEQLDPVDITSPLLQVMVSDRKETVRERFWTHETPYFSPELLVHTARMGDPSGLKSMQNARDRIRLEPATRVDAISISRVRATRSEAGRFERFGIRNFWQLIGRAEGRAAGTFLDRSEWTEKAGIDGKDITRRIVHESVSTRWSVASQQTELWGRWWENPILYWQKSRATWLPRTMAVHPRLPVLQPIVFPRSRQHPQAKSEWMLETLSEVSSSPLELKIFQGNEISKMFSSVLPNVLHRADAGRTKQQVVRERFKQLFHLAQQFSKTESERGQSVLVSRQRLKQIESRREEQSSALSHWLRQFVISRERQSTVLASLVEQEQPSSILFHPSKLLLPFASIANRNQRIYALLQQLTLQEARLNEIVREQSILLRSSHEQTHFGKTSMISVVSRASSQQLDMLQHKWWTGLSLHVLHPIQGLPFPLQMTHVTDSSRTVPLLSQSVVRKSIAAYWINSFQSANAPVFFEKRGWLNQPWIKEYLETHNEIERGPAGITSTARFEWNRFVQLFHTNRQLWQTLQNQIDSSTHHETNRKSVMASVHLQQMAAKQLRARELLASRWLRHLLNVLTKESTSFSKHEVSNHIEGISQPFFQSTIHFLQNRHVYQLPYETVHQLLWFQSGKNKRADVAFFKNQETFSLLGRKATISKVHEHEHRPIRHTVFLRNERSTSGAFLQTHRHDREVVSLRLSRFGSAMLRATEWIGLGGTDHQQLYSTSAKPFSSREDVSDRNSLRRLATGWSAELGLTILLQKSAKLAAMSAFAKVGSISTSGKAPPSSEKQSRHSRFLQQTASLWTNSIALRARPYLQVLQVLQVMEQIRKAIQTDFRTEAYVQNHHSLATVLNRHDAQLVVQKQWGPLPSPALGQSVGVPDSFIHASGSRRATERLTRKGRVNSLESLSRHHPISSVPFASEKFIDLVMDRLNSRQLSRRSRFQQTNHEQILTVNQKAQTFKRLTSDKTQEVEVRDARLTPLQRPGIFNMTSTTPMAAEKVEHAEKNTSLTLLPKPMLAMAKQPPLLQALQQAQRAPGESEQFSLSENATHIHRRALRTDESHASPATTAQSPPMEFLRKNIRPQETAVQQTTTLPLQRQVDLHVQERAGNQTSLSPQEVDRLMDKMMKELDKRLTQERQRRGL
ncbi:hypothetical protein ACFU8X_01835 [Brevibacillus porteri]|uniref:hypothetical protein n=1 Tax=Brevibacillus porteri TaxID=2126350 RepID=UPI00370A1AF9